MHTLHVRLYGRDIGTIERTGGGISFTDEASWSLAGAQSKFTLARVEQSWAYAYGSTPSTHIVKPGITRLEDQALIEHVSMRSLAAPGISVADTEYVEFGSEPAIVIGR